MQIYKEVNVDHNDNFNTCNQCPPRVPAAGQLAPAQFHVHHVAPQQRLPLASLPERHHGTRRRLEVGDLTFLFENDETVRYQILEMVRVEQIVKESDIQHELDTYNDLLGKTGELGCTLLIGLEDEQERDAKLTAWEGLLPHLYLVLEDGSRVGATWDPRQVGSDRLSAVQYLRFAAGDLAPFLGRMGEEVGVADGVYLLAVFGRAQRTLRVHPDQARWDGPGLPSLRAIETQCFSRAGSGQECERGC